MTRPATVDAAWMSLAQRCVSAPHVSPSSQAAQRIGEWVAEIDAGAAASLGAVMRDHPVVDSIIQGIADASPFLFDLIRADPDRLVRLLTSDPDEQLDALLASTRNVVAHADDEATAMRALRRQKQEAALLTALCDIGGVWSVMRITRALTDVAVTSVRHALRFMLSREVLRGRLLPRDLQNLEDGSGLVVLAMGKMGADELNYSSDIDLIVFYDSEGASLAPDVEAQPLFVRVTQGLARLLQQRTGDGYVFRVDLRLRPDPASTQVAMSTAAALHYYEREGRTWERAAMIKARACAGDARAGERLLADLSPFVWRKHLDFAALADVHDMKRQMHAFKGHGDIAVEGHNVKVGRGGIREIEFFAQTQQLIAGGRHPELRVRPTLDALNVLATSNWITFQARDELIAAYLFLRRVEHRLQMVADEQTHTLPDTAEGVAQFAHFLGYADRSAFADELLGHLHRVQAHYSKLFEGDPAGTARLPDVDFGAGPDDSRLTAHLASLGFKTPMPVAQAIAQWLRGDYRALKTDATRQAFSRFVPALIEALARADDPDSAVITFDRFLQALARGGRLITLLSQNSELVALIALVLAAAPRLGDMLAQQPQLMDGLIDPRFFGAMPDRREVSQRLAATLADAGSYEEFLDRLRLFGQESLFLIGTRILSGTVTARNAAVAFADVGEGIARTVHDLVTGQFAAQHGRLHEQETAVLAMGRLGSREMNASSDLDLILIYDFDHDKPDSDGPKPLQGAQYFARLTQRLISAFTTRTNYGVLYDIDMRLRPSGRAGPLASRIDSFANYQEREAWTWEHMALTRARVISSSPAFEARIARVIHEVLTRPRDRDVIARDVAEMRRAIATEKGESDVWDLKYVAGGMIDIEFIAQYLQLVHAANMPDILDVGTAQVLDNAARLNVLSPADSDVLRPAIRFYQDLNQILRLCVATKFSPDSAGEGLRRVLARAGEEPNFSVLEARLRDTQREVRAIFERLLPVD